MRTTLFRKISGYLLAFLLICTAILPGCGGSAKVTISTLVISPGQTEVNQPVTISANILSSDTKDVSYSAELKINETKIESKEVSVSPGETKTISFLYTPSSLGKYNVDVNGQKATFEVVNPAKIEPGTLSASKTNPVVGEEVTFTATVKNTGGLSGTYSYALKIDGDEISSNDVTISAGRQETLTESRTFDTAGEYVIEFCDSTVTITVLKPAEFEADSIKVSPSSMYTWESATVTATITNTGDTEGTLPVALKVNGKETSSKDVTLAAHESTDVTFTVRRDAAGHSKIEVLNKSASLTVKELEEYASEVYFYSISYPSDFEVNDSDTAAVWIDNSEGYLLIGIDAVPNNQTPQEYLDFVEGLQSVYEDWESTHVTEIKDGDTVIGYSYDYTQLIDDVKWEGITHVIRNGGYGYTIDFSSEATDWDDYKTIAQKCLESFVPPTVYTGEYDDPEAGLKLTLPGEWNATSTGDAASPIVLRSGYDHPGITGTFALEAAGDYSAEEYTDYFVTMMEAAGYQNVKKTAFTFTSGDSGYECSGTVGNDELEMKIRIINVVEKSMLYSFTILGTKTEMNADAGEITAMVKSLEVSTPTLEGYDRSETLVLWGGEIPNLDPARTDTTPGSYIGTLFSGLVKLNTAMEPVADLAESWTVSDDGTTYTFTLKSNATFHDGTPVTAADVKYSWERACDPATEAPNAQKFLNDIVGAQDMIDGTASSISGITVIDDTTLEVKIDSAKQYFLDELTQPVAFIVDKSNVEQGDKWYENPNGTGPFKLKEWDQNTKLIFERNDNFYSSAAKVKYIYFKLYSGIPLTLYERDEIDIATVYGSSIDRVLDPDEPLNDELLIGDDTSIIYISLNNSMPPFDDPLVRKAFAKAIDVDKLIEVLYNDRAEKAAGYMTPSVPGYNASLQPMEYDVEGALQLIAESSYGSVDNLPEITVSSAYALGSDMEAIIGMWQQNLGIQVKVDLISTAENFMEKMRDREIQVYWSGWGLDYPDPQNILEILFHSNSPENGEDYSNPDIDAALIAAGIEGNESARMQQYRDIEQRILEEMPLIPLYHSIKDYVLVKPYVKGFNLYPLNINIWTEISLDPH